MKRELLIEDWDLKHFTPDEFMCPCGCKTMRVSERFARKLDLARDIAEEIDKNDYAFYLNSGCRCPEHNTEINGKEHSLHLADETRICEAADIAFTSDHKMAVVLISLVKAGFTHIGIGSNFIHADDSDKTGSWLYS